MKREVARFDFKAFGQAIKAARKAKGISRNQLADKMNIAPRYIASIENSGQHPRHIPIRKHRGAREKRYSFGYAVFLILALMK